MRFLIQFFKAYAKLLYFDLFYARNKAASLYATVRAYPTAQTVSSNDDVSHLSLAMDYALIWYFRETPCLLRSAALVCLLRDHGHSAKLVTASQQMPFKSHAWVIDADGRILNDKPYVSEIYTVLDQC